jgi:hypothetical protein
MVTNVNYGDIKAGSAAYISMVISMTFSEMTTTA